ncbi:hypothetical protein QQ045_001398 [Rhodiola kirilowii]
MADQPVPRADGGRVNADIATALAALTTKMAAMSTQLAEVVNKSRRADGREELNRVPQGKNNRAANLSSKKKVDYGDQQNTYDYQVKSDIPLFYGTMGGQKFLNWQVEVDRFFDVMGVPKNIQVKMAGMRLKSVASVWWD